MNLTPLGVLGVRTADGSIAQLLDLRVAAENRTVFTTIADGQRKAVFDCYYRGLGFPGWIYLDSLSMSRIPAARAGEPDLKLEAGELEKLLRDKPPEVPRSPQPPVPLALKRGRRLLLAVTACAVLAAGALFLIRTAFNWEVAKSTSLQASEKTPPAEPPVTVEKPAPPSRHADPPVTEAPPVAQGTPADPSNATPAIPASEYRIGWGDTLWRIAERFYGEPGLYPQLAESNALADPDRIVAGESLVPPAALTARKRKNHGE